MSLIYFTKMNSHCLFSQDGEVLLFSLEGLLMNCETSHQDMLFLLTWPVFPSRNFIQLHICTMQEGHPPSKENGLFSHSRAV